MMFLLVTSAGPFRAEDLFALLVEDLSAADVRIAIAAMSVFRNVALAARDMSALAEHDTSVGIRVFDEVVVEYLAVFPVDPNLPSSLALGLHRVSILQPVADIEIVDVLFHNVIAAQPVEVVPVTTLVFEFGLFRFSGVDPHAITIPVTAHQVDIADSAVLQLLDRFDVGSFVPPLQTDLYDQVFFASQFVGFQNPANARAVDGNRFFHEDVLAGRDSLFKLQGPKPGWRRQNHQINVGVQQTFKGVESSKLLTVRDLNLVAMFDLVAFVRSIQAIFKQIRHGHEIHRTARRVHRLIGGLRTPASAADQADLYGVGTGDMSRPGQRKPGSDGRADRNRRRACLQKRPPILRFPFSSVHIGPDSFKGCCITGPARRGIAIVTIQIRITRERTSGNLGQSLRGALLAFLAIILMGSLSVGCGTNRKPTSRIEPDRSTGHHEQGEEARLTHELQLVEYRQPAMGVELVIQAWTADYDAAVKAIGQAAQRVEQLEEILSDYREDSEVKLVSQSLMKATRVSVSDDLMDVLVRSRKMWEVGEGKFDVTIGPLSALWREARKSGKLPDPLAAKEALARIGFGHLTLDPENGTIELAAGKPVPQFDFGAIGKGYAADEALRVLRESGIPAALVELGGDLACGSPPPGRMGWRIALSSVDRELKNPDGNLVYAELSNCGIATSGDRHQFMEVDGVRYSHLIDPRSGEPLTCSRLVTAIAPSGADADALATIFSLTAPEDAIGKADSLEGVSVYVEEMDAAGNCRVFVSPRFPPRHRAGD